MSRIMTKRIYESASASDGFRVLVDRLWPRGLKKENAEIDIWLKEIGPSNELRKWFNHDPKKWNEFQKRYSKELKGSEAVETLLGYVKKNKKLTLLYSAKDEEHNQAVVLQKYMEKLIREG